MIAESFIHEEIAGSYRKRLGQCTLNVVKFFYFLLFWGASRLRGGNCCVLADFIKSAWNSSLTKIDSN